MKNNKERRQPPIDPRLWKASRSARSYLVLSVVVGVLIAAQMIVVAWCIATITSGIITDPSTRHLSAWTQELSLLAGMIVLRALTGWVQDRFAHRSAGRVVLDLRLALLRATRRTNPRVLAANRDELRTVATSGLDGLPAYLISYIPALMLAATVSPLTWLAILWADRLSAIIIALTIPLIPLFMILVGMLTEERTRRHLNSMKTLASTLLDLVAGLPHPHLPRPRKSPRPDRSHSRRRALRRQHGLAAHRVPLQRRTGTPLHPLRRSRSRRTRLPPYGLHRRSSSLNAIFVLILVADVYKPLRTVGQNSTTPKMANMPPTVPSQPSPWPKNSPRQPETDSAGTLAPASCIAVTDLTIDSRGAYAPYQLSFTAEPGQITVLTGANGVGKSTSFLSILGMPGMLPGDPGVQGDITVDGHPVASIPTAQLWDHVSWLPQRAALIAGTVLDNLGVPTTAGGTSVSDTGPFQQLDMAAIADAAHQTGFDLVLDQLPNGYDMWLGSGGLGLSLGQRQRLALTRTLADTTRHVLLLDEPTAHLDGEAEARVIARLRERAAAGDTILIVGHRDKLLQAADKVVQVARLDKDTEDSGETSPVSALAPTSEEVDR
ncbi:MAG: ATP-binding cassette domain-containing protein [Lawsonella clevelandensis]